MEGFGLSGRMVVFGLGLWGAGRGGMRDELSCGLLCLAVFDDERGDGVFRFLPFGKGDELWWLAGLWLRDSTHPTSLTRDNLSQGPGNHSSIPLGRIPNRTRPITAWRPRILTPYSPVYVSTRPRRQMAVTKLSGSSFTNSSRLSPPEEGKKVLYCKGPFRERVPIMPTPVGLNSATQVTRQTRSLICPGLREHRTSRNFRRCNGA